MGLDEDIQRGYCYNDLEIKKLIGEGRIRGNNICTESNKATGEKTQVQPCSFDPRISNEVFVLSTQGVPIFRANEHEQVYTTLIKEVSSFRRRKHDCTDGYELKKGFSYLLPLEERVTLQKGEYVKSSPKSSLGRLFVDSRLMVDYCNAHDEFDVAERELQMYLLVQPLCFNMVVYPGLRLNQLRFMTGDDPRLTDREIKELHKKHPLAFEFVDGEYRPVSERQIRNGLGMRLDLLGRNTNGIVGFKAIDNPDPLDLRQTFSSKKPESEQQHLPKIEDYFEPIIANGNNSYEMHRGDHCLFATLEKLDIPGHISGELKANSSQGISGPCHFAGFFDPGWKGDIVLEWRSDELTGRVLTHGMPVSTTDIFRNNNPEREYGKAIGSNYHGQVGVRVSKYFLVPDFGRIAKDYQKLNRVVMVQEAPLVKRLRKRERSGFESISQAQGVRLVDLFCQGFPKSRYECETDEAVLQPIPYILFFNGDEQVYTYLRANKIEDFGEKRLFDKRSIGIGGHVHKTDGPQYIQAALVREISEEVNIIGTYSPPHLVGTLLCDDLPVDRVHFGLVYASLVTGSVEHKESSIVKGEMMHINDLQNPEMPLLSQNMETWSRVLIPELREIYERVIK